MRTLSVTFSQSRRLSLRGLCLEALGYALVSGVALGVDAGLLQALVALARWHYLPASAVSFVVGAVVAYVLSVRFVFRHRQLTSRAREFGFFLAIGLVGLLVNTAALSVAVTGIGLGLMTAKGIAATCTFATNFMLRRSLLFSPPRTAE